MIKYILFCSTVIVLYSCSRNPQEEAKESESESATFVDAQPGFFKGNLPCKDCEGILTLIELKDDSTAILFETYKGKDEIPFATFGTWSSTNELVTFTDGSGTERLYKATEEGLIVADLADSEHNISLDRYKLTIDFSKPFISKGRYFYMADAHIFTFMGDKIVYPVITNQENLNVEQQFMQLSEDEQKCFCIQVKGQLVETEDMEGRIRKHLEIIEFLDVVSKICSQQEN